jgi:putative pyoverdin transport system ATP-binding/permease protein
VKIADEMNLFRFLLQRSRSALLLAIFCGLLSGAMNSALLAVVNFAISGRSSISRTVLLEYFVVFWMLAPITRVISEVTLIRLGQRAIFALRVELSQQILNIPLRNMEELGTHRILPVLTDDIPNITNMVSIVPIVCINASVVLSCLGYMAWMNSRLLFGVIGCMLIGIITYQLGVRRAAKHFRSAREHDGSLHKHFHALLAGIKELKLHRTRRIAFMTSMLERAANHSRIENTAGLTSYAVAASWGQLLVFTTMGAVVFGLNQITHYNAATLVGFPLALIYLMTPLQVIMNAVPGMTRANVAIRKVHELGLTMVEYHTSEMNTAVAEERFDTPVRLAVDNLVYSYCHEELREGFSLGPLTFEVCPGELLFLTGGNGSGKTTLAKLLLGLYTPSEGKVLFNGEPVTDQNRDQYRQLFSAVFSDCFLFEALLGLQSIDLDMRAKEHLVSLRLDHKVQVQNGILSTTELSQGQRKRLALLTCCLEDRPIFFFDEWAADQDPTFKEVFYREILPSLKERGKTIIVISHDDRYFSVADRILHLESGRISSEAYGDHSKIQPFVTIAG